MAGTIDVLATGKGHDELTLPDNHQEAKAKVDELLSKGYTITVQVGEGDAKTDKKVSGFDGEKGEYLIKEVKTTTETVELRVPAAQAKATAIAPVAGG